MSTSTLLTAASEQENLINYSVVQSVLYQGYLQFDGSPAAIELFIGGVDGRRLQIPEDTIVTGMYNFTAWNVTDDTVATQMGMFGIENDGGTVAFAPADLDGEGNFVVGSGTNPLEILGSTVEGTLSITADDTLDALQIEYTGTASKNYSVRVLLFGMVAVGEGVVLTPIPTQTQAG
jgi:hypothetical protein